MVLEGPYYFKSPPLKLSTLSTELECIKSCFLVGGGT